MGRKKHVDKVKVQAMIAQRREQVARLLIRKFSIREIVQALANSGAVNPDTGGPWAIQTIHSDKKAIEKQWRDRAFEHVDKHKSQILADLEEVQRAGWTEQDLRLVLDAVKQKRAVLGTDAPQKQEISGEGIIVKVINFDDATDVDKDASD